MSAPAAVVEPSRSTRLTQRLLLIGPSNIGDAILVSPCLSELVRRYPEAHLALVVGARATRLFIDDPRVQTLVDAGRFGSAAGRVRLAWALWRYRPHIVVDLRHTLFPFLLKPLWSVRYLRRPPPSITHMRDRHLWELRAQVPALRTRQAEARILGPAGVGRVPDDFWCSPKDVAHAEMLLARWRQDPSRPMVLMAPGARSHIKRWTAEGFARVADRLAAELGCEVVLTGEPEEEPIIEEVLGLMAQRVHSAVGLVTVRQLGALMRHAALVITNDSASLHVASAVGAPTVALFGPTDPAKYGPTAPRHRLLRRRLFCAPCEQALCRYRHECMRFVTADEVYEAARDVLERGACVG